MYDEHPYIKKAYRLARERLGRKRHPFLKILLFEHTLNVYFDVYHYESKVGLRAATLLFEVMRSGNTDFKEMSDSCGYDVALVVQELVFENRRMSDDERLEYLIKKVNAFTAPAFLIYLSDIKNIVTRLEDAVDPNLREFLWQTREIMQALKKEPDYAQQNLLKEIFLALEGLGYGSVRRESLNETQSL